MQRHEAVGVIGLGAMGSSAARRLLSARREVVGHDVAAERVRMLAAEGMIEAQSVAEVVRRADVILTLLPSVAALEVVVGEGLRDSARHGLTVVEMSTLPLEAKLWMRDELAPLGVVVLDCPISGTAAQAAQGDLAFYLSGDAQAAEGIRPVLATIGRSTHYVGEFGSGSKVKFAANLLVAIHNVAAAEALVLAKAAGIDLDLALRVLTDGAGTSRMLEVRGPMMVAGRFTPATMPIRLFRKDLDIILEFARALGSPTPLLESANRIYEAARDSGREEEDTGSVFAVLADLLEASS